ncbi:hypothetical protein EIP86_007914 [Pleurotus ostreatoroseus]|nr:hypothetical protein EIP86_007914 [Pleurotus ostreatoroseus]
MNVDEATDTNGEGPPVPDIGCDSVYGIPAGTNMREFWEDAWAWLAQRGVHLYETSYEPVNNMYANRWLTPSSTSDTNVLPWGDNYSILDMDSVREVLRFIECLLKGLALLGQALQQHRKTDSVYYAFMDYDQSIILPSETCVRTCLRPMAEWQYGSPQYKPLDIAPGQLTYNPFAYDVGMLGNMFCYHFSNVVRFVPALAALFDKMTTHLIPQRFTAEEAYAFFREATKDLGQETLLTQVKLEFRYEIDSVYWDHLSLDVQRKWDYYRTPATESDPEKSADGAASESGDLSKPVVVSCIRNNMCSA